jgi:hypothetical protein
MSHSASFFTSILDSMSGVNYFFAIGTYDCRRSIQRLFGGDKQNAVDCMCPDLKHPGNESETSQVLPGLPLVTPTQVQ